MGGGAIETCFGRMFPKEAARRGAIMATKVEDMNTMMAMGITRTITARTVMGFGGSMKPMETCAET